MEETSTAEKPSRLGGMFRALKYRNYRLFFMGQSISLIGTWMQQIAMSWLVYRLTDSVFLLGMVSFANQIPSFLLGPFAGVISDRFNRHRVLLLTQFLFLLEASILAALVLTDTITIHYILALGVFAGIVNAFDMSARQALVVQLVEKREDMSNAIALNSSMFNMARLVGPSVAGGIIATLGEGVCFLINALSYLAVLTSLLLMRLPVMERKVQDTQVLKSLGEGFRYAFGFAPIRDILVLIATLSLFGMPFTVLMPAIARDVLGGDASTLGLLMGASGVGALIGALYLASRKSVLGLGRVIVGASVLFGVGLIGFALSKTMLLSMVGIFVVGLGMILRMASSNTLLQTIVDDDKRGRVMSFYSMAFMGMAPIGSLLAGWVAERIGVAYTLLGCGIICLVSIVPFVRSLPRSRELVRPIYQRLGILPEIADGLQTASTLSSPPEGGKM
ncbi:MFS transporter [Rufibacter latericius]|uniref:MFS transporter n=1 Tax=Rufibacter latericius TaxID=2487040 RepID=A0A3M9N0K3_9BACT|nr:MFS transporter [Rufibacter latericius]RNI31310.1 MFS transporter [Rufibacter latericius]